ncbi:hypothetical protein [Streptomyces johnsoniae]|uniref:Uncharacterized protein n=1 Tax=Streptomyces johnsoniae TaxID=3075532 RepID=A0ABU2SCG3_9ACTN|nr:hypothetical protein [Streptomyces sp. DSM 41886]MDT0446664.1 hypothetical protein [Streptomyces sp. DSM 41886]
MPDAPLPVLLMGLDLERDLSPRQGSGTACVLCRAWLGHRPGERSRVLATVNGRPLHACSPACGGRP